MINSLQVLIGLGGLLLGTLVYLVDRPPDQTYFLYSSSINISLHDTLPNLFGIIGNSLPAFIHIFSFILITAGLIFCQKSGYLIICLSWFLVDSAFELGQKYSTWSSSIIPTWFAEIPFLENTKNYFLQGTFDFIDLAAIAFGTLIAYFVLLITNKTKKRVMS
jgi:hypothetical protein